MVQDGMLRNKLELLYNMCYKEVEVIYMEYNYKQDMKAVREILTTAVCAASVMF